MSADNANIVLAGFMGTGKSTVGRALAARLGRRFVDMDEILVERLGAPIADIFARYGEEHFRRAERALCQELGEPSSAVIAAGGGAIVNLENRLALARGGLLFCLTCTPAEALRRIGDPASRPMLHGDNPAKRIAHLMSERSPAYETIPRQIDTTHLSAEAVVERVLAMYRRDCQRQMLPVQHDRGAYDIVYGEGVLSHLGEIMAERGLRGQVAIITNTVVGPLYRERVMQSLHRAGLRPFVVEIADGERAKTLETVARIYDRLADAGLERGEPVLALGGGVVGDIAGLAAATYMRGVPLVQTPTTVLSMVDSSVGGKVGVDHPRGKNLIGAFKQPEVVVIDPAVLLSLPPAERRSGLAEIVKHGVIGAPDILDHLEQESTPDLSWLIPRAVQVKIDIVQQDPYEQGRRAELNLGHTFGHALENLSGYRLRHGEAVSIGMVIATRLAVRLGLCSPSLAERVEGILRRLGLPVRYQGYSPDAIWDAMATDKKRKGGCLRVVLPLRAGNVTVTGDAPQPLVLDILKEIRE